MTTATVRSVIERFLKSDVPEVLVLKGAWGVGKTFIWNRLTKEFKASIKPDGYCYVSLFGISSMQELRLAIFAKTKSVRLIGEKVTIETINKEWMSLALSGGKNALAMLKKLAGTLPYVKEVTIGLETLAPHLIGPTLICLDDFERLSKQVQADELLGFVSSLKEDKQCKVVLIFNEEKLDTNELTYKKYREKLVDIELLFAPTAEEVTDIVFKSDSPWRDEACRRAVSLAIKNIRLLRKIDRLISLIHESTKGLHQKVMEQTVQTVVLVAWAFYEPDSKKPSMEFLRQFNSFAMAFKRVARNRGQQQQGEEDLRHVEWEKLLDDYGFRNMDELDLAIIKVVEQGHIEETGFAEAAKKLDERHRAEEFEQSFSNAWRLFHDTFANNKADLVAALRDSFKRSVRHITPINVNGTVELLRELGENDIADELINFYVKERGNEPELFDMSKYAFARDISDTTLRSKFEEKHQSSNPPPTLHDAALRMSEGGGWSEAEMRAMDQASEDDFYSLFKMDHGDKLHKIVKAGLQAGGEAGHQELGKRVRAALIRIAKESDVNAIRVSRYVKPV